MHLIMGQYGGVFVTPRNHIPPPLIDSTRIETGPSRGPARGSVVDTKSLGMEGRINSGQLV